MARGASKARLRALRKRYGLGEFRKRRKPVRVSGKSNHAGVRRRVRSNSKRKPVRRRRKSPISSGFWPWS